MPKKSGSQKRKFIASGKDGATVKQQRMLISDESESSQPFKVVTGDNEGANLFLGDEPGLSHLVTLPEGAKLFLPNEPGPSHLVKSQKDHPIRRVEDIHDILFSPSDDDMEYDSSLDSQDSEEEEEEEEVSPELVREIVPADSSSSLHDLHVQPPAPHGDFPHLPAQQWSTHPPAIRDHRQFSGKKNVAFSSPTSPRSATSTNLVGKFTQSVRRIVQDVKDEGTASGLSKEEVMETNERLRAVRIRLDDSYDTAKKALVGLMAKYADSKTVRNVFQRYTLLKAMIKEVIRLETQYWTLVDIPKQEKQETVPAFVLRACAIMEKTQKSGEGVKTAAKIAEEEDRRKERLERLSDMVTAQIEAENTQMTNDLYRLLKKYSGLRNIIRELKTEYLASKVYPIFPRYTILKDLIKDIMHNPDYMEVCHEVDPV